MKRSERQELAWDTIERPDVREVMYGGAKGGGKSVLGCYWSHWKAWDIIKKCNIEPREHPIPVGFMGRKHAKDFRETTLETWKRFIPSDQYKIVGKPEAIIIGDRVKLFTGGMDKSKNINKFNSMELAFYFVDQAEEVTQDEIGELRATTRLIINGVKVPGKGLFTANPAQCFLKEEFIINPDDNRKFIPALPGDNPFLGPEYQENLRQSFKHRPELIEAYLHGSWDSLDANNQLILGKWLRDARNKRMPGGSVKKILTCDPARYGDDLAVIYYMENTVIKRIWVRSKTATTEISGLLHKLRRETGASLIVCDSQPTGVVDELIDMGNPVLEFIASAACPEPEKYYNLRAYAWSKAAEELSEGRIAMGEKPDDADDEDWLRLTTELCLPTYTFRGGRVLVESKKDIKKRYNKSTDYADPYIMGLYALDYASEETFNDEIRKGSRDKPINPMAA